MVNALPVPLSWRSSLMMACAVAAIAGTFSTRITTRPERLTVRICSIDFASDYAEGTFVVLEPMPRIRFNDATPTNGRGAAEAALFRESVERMDRP